MEPRAVWSALKLRWKSSVAGLLLGVAFAAGVSAVMGPSFTSSMQFFVSTADSASTSDAFQGKLATALMRGIARYEADTASRAEALTTGARTATP